MGRILDAKQRRLRKYREWLEQEQRRAQRFLQALEQALQAEDAGGRPLPTTWRLTIGGATTRASRARISAGTSTW